MDSSSCRIGATELLLDDQLSGLEAVLVQLGAREAVVNKVSGLGGLFGSNFGTGDETCEGLKGH